VKWAITYLGRGRNNLRIVDFGSGPDLTLKKYVPSSEYYGIDPLFPNTYKDTHFTKIKGLIEEQDFCENEFYLGYCINVIDTMPVEQLYIVLNKMLKWTCNVLFVINPSTHNETWWKAILANLTHIVNTTIIDGQIVIFTTNAQIKDDAPHVVRASSIVDIVSIDKEIWLAGKGPSLETFDWSKAGKYRVGINEVAYLIPDCWGAICVDGRIYRRYQYDPLPEGVIVFRRNDRKINYPKMYIWKLGTEVRHPGATAMTAIQLFHYLGARIFHFVGFDSMSNIPGYANSILNIKGKGTSQDNYAGINKRIRQIIAEFKIECIWEHEK
jgi:hypothetical protein